MSLVSETRGDACFCENGSLEVQLRRGLIPSCHVNAYEQADANQNPSVYPTTDLLEKEWPESWEQDVQGECDTNHHEQLVRCHLEQEFSGHTMWRNALGTR